MFCEAKIVSVSAAGLGEFPFGQLMRCLHAEKQKEKALSGSELLLKTLQFNPPFWHAFRIAFRIEFINI